MQLSRAAFAAKVWRRVVLLKWKPDACPSAVEKAFNLHRSFARKIPAVLSVSEGRTYSGGTDGNGAYKGEHNVNKGFDSAIEILTTCESMAEVKSQYFDHPVHTAAAAIIDPLIEDAWAMDWVEDRASVRVPSATSSFVKHIVFFKFQEAATRQQRDALLAAWRTLPADVPEVLALSCGDAMVPEKARGFHTGVVADIALEEDGIEELHKYHYHPATLAVSKTFLKPIVAGFVVLDFAEHRGGRGAVTGV